MCCCARADFLLLLLRDVFGAVRWLAPRDIWCKSNMEGLQNTRFSISAAGVAVAVAAVAFLGSCAVCVVRRHTGHEQAPTALYRPRNATFAEKHVRGARFVSLFALLEPAG